MLRLITYLSPSIPAALYELIARDLAEQCGGATDLSFEESISGPLEGDEDPFASGAADVGFVCSPSFRFFNGRNGRSSCCRCPSRPIIGRKGSRSTSRTSS